MNSEIGNNEVNEVRNPSVENFRNIKPENEMTSHEAVDFWTTEFHDQAEQARTELSEKTELLLEADKQDIPEHQDAARRIPCKNENLAGQTHPETGVPFERRFVTADGETLEVCVPIFDSSFDAQLPEDILKASDAEQFKECNRQLREAVQNDPEFRAQFTEEELEQIENGDTPDGYTWHHDADVGKMQLVDTETHQKTGHTGGRYIWGGGSVNR